MHFPELYDSEFKPLGRVVPLSHSLKQKANNISTAEMRLRYGEYNVNVGDWMELFTPNGRTAGIFRVTMAESDLQHNELNVSLEHGFGTLSDRVVNGPLNAGNFSNNGGITSDTKIPMHEIVEKLLEYQDVWKLDACEFDEKFSFKFENTNVYAALKKVCKSIGNYQFTFDQSSRPWKFSIIKKDPNEKATCEMRMTRNIASMRYSLDRTGMATRIYAYGKEAVSIESVNNGLPYVEKNTETWGIVEEIYTDSNQTEPALLLSSAQIMLDQRCQPIVTVTIDGFDLAEATGEPMDALVLGRVCRVPLPGVKGFDDKTVNERIVALNWRDLVNTPDVVTVTLANSRETITTLAAKSNARGGGGGGNGGGGGDNETTDREMTRKYARIDVEEANAFIKLVAGVESRESFLDGNFKTISEASVTIDGQASQISAKADRIELNGYVTMGAFEAEQGRINTLFADYVKASEIEADLADIRTLKSGNFGAITINAASINGTFISASGGITSGGVVAGASINAQGGNVQCGTINGKSIADHFKDAIASFPISDYPGYEAAMETARSEGAASVTGQFSAGGTSYNSTNKTISFDYQLMYNGEVVSSRRLTVGAGDAFNDGKKSVDTSTIEDEAYKKGWLDGYNRAASKCYRVGNYVYGASKTTVYGTENTQSWQAIYTASEDSYTPSSFSMSSPANPKYTPSTHSYTASSFSWSR